MNRPRLTLLALLVAAFGLAPIAMPAGAAPCAGAPTLDPTCLANEPLQSKVTAPPNVVLTLDDSSSMLADYLPDFVIGNYCRSSTGSMTVACGNGGAAKSPGYIYSTTNVPYPNYAPGNPPNPFAYTTSSVPTSYQLWAPPVHSGDFNKQYYNPRYTYDTPIQNDAARTPYPQQDASAGTLKTWQDILTDIWAPTAPTNQQKKVNLAALVAVPLFCNNDWPTDTSIGTLGRYTAGKGYHCRINGTAYDPAPAAPASTGAPAVNAEYQYPWGPAVPGLKDPKYFNRIGGNKLVYCKSNAAAEWPQTCAATGAWSCNTGTLVPAPDQDQKCVFSSNKTGACANVYSPAGCNTNPAYDLGGCTGSECKVCTNLGCTPPVTGKNGLCRLKSTGLGGSGAGCSCTPAGCDITAVACAKYNSGTPTCSDASAPVRATVCAKVASPTCTNVLWDPVGNKPSATTILADSNGAGILCRHNNQNYAGAPNSAPFNYPAAPYNAYTANSSNCGTVPSTVSIPRHYWKTSVEWCTTRIVTANDKWERFGLSDGTCQDTHDATHIYPRFYTFGKTKADPEYADNVANPAFERVDLDITNRAACNGTPCYKHDWSTAKGPKNVTRGFDAEMTNYANWFTYYRTRILATKTTTSLAYQSANLDDFRMSLQTLSNGFAQSSFVNLAAFDPAGHRKTWYDALFKVNIAMGVETPNLDAIVRIGEWFRTGASGSLSGSTDPLFDPKLTCQKNYHILFTDGITNQSALPTTTVGNVDVLVPPLPVPMPAWVTPSITAGFPWPKLYQEGPTPINDTASDYTTYYWVTKLRAGWDDDVPATLRDPASWQHLNFAALSLGTEGTLASAQPKATENKLEAGTLTWPAPTPNQYKPNATGVDDLWHAALNGRGRFVNAQNSRQLRNGFEDILQDITNNQGSRAGTTVSNPNFSLTNHYVYSVRFIPGWGGSLQKIDVDPATAEPLDIKPIGPNPVWDAQDNLTTAMAKAGTPWYDLRKIVTMDDSRKAVPFLKGSISNAQFNTLGGDDATRLSVLEYLRGRRDGEGTDEDSFRIRVSPLGDIVNSQAVVVSPPNAPFLDGNDPGYDAFKKDAAYSIRPTRIFVTANDGMVHAFDDATGDEAWAYIPHDLYRGPLATDGLFGLSVQPLFDHHMLVDAPPRASDVYYAGNWHSILVGGLGKGGRSYYALDITDPASIKSEGDAASKVLWEFRDGDNGADIGYTSGKPLVAKLRAYGWVVIVSAGYNNSTGVGKLYILDPEKGKLLHTLTTSSGTAAAPSGLVHFAGYTKDFRNQIIEQIYAGDLNGDFWRWDVSDADTSKWNGGKAIKFASLTDGGKGQPVTTPPQIEVDIQNGVDRWVFVGTGRLLDNDDLKNTDVQTMYAFRDGTNLAPSGAAKALTRDDLEDVRKDDAAGIEGLNARPTNGWFEDLKDESGSRIVVAPQAELGLVGYIATSPPTDPCSTSAPSRVFVREFARGNSRLLDPDDPKGIAFMASMYVAEGGAGIDVVALDASGGGGSYATIPDIRMVITTSNDATVIPLKVKLPDAIGAHRMNWRQLGE
ncbi:MAG: PilC/PilY family type IV pilus protein [Betaproteobacteria bacterium]